MLDFWYGSEREYDPDFPEYDGNFHINTKRNDLESLAILYAKGHAQHHAAVNDIYYLTETREEVEVEGSAPIVVTHEDGSISERKNTTTKVRTFSQVRPSNAMLDSSHR